MKYQMLFVYETLKNKGLVKKVLGHPRVEVRAALPGYTEVFVKKDDDTWPTLVLSPDDYVKGDIIDVTGDDLIKLDAWEDHYIRQSVRTSAGKAWTYILKGKS